MVTEAQEAIVANSSERTRSTLIPWLQIHGVSWDGASGRLVFAMAHYEHPDAGIDIAVLRTVVPGCKLQPSPTIADHADPPSVAFLPTVPP